MIQPRIVQLEEKKLIGKRLKMNLIHDRTGDLWSNFAPRIKEIKHTVSSDKISMQLYGDDFHSNFNPNNEFEKWAAVEVSNFDSVPKEMETFLLPGGQYAVFDYKGLSSDGSIFQYIFSNWLPESEYNLDQRPHFEMLGDKYRNNDPESEEEIWIPIKN